MMLKNLVATYERCSYNKSKYFGNKLILNHTIQDTLESTFDQKTTVKSAKINTKQWRKLNFNGLT